MCYIMHRQAQNHKLLVRILITQTKWEWFESQWEWGLKLTVMDCFCSRFDIRPKRCKDTQSAARIKSQDVLPHPDFLVRQASKWQWDTGQLVDMCPLDHFPLRNNATTTVPHNIKWVKRKIFPPWWRTEKLKPEAI